MDKFLQKVSHQDYMPTGARKHPKKSQEFRGGESGENYYFYIAAGKILTLRQINFFGSAGSIRCAKLSKTSHYVRRIRFSKLYLNQ